MTLNAYQLQATKTADGRPWVQRCFVCDRPINYLKLASVKWIRVGSLVRHKKCFPGAPK